MQTVPQDSNTTAHARPIRRTAPIDPQAADRLLDLLSTDDTFRTLFIRDPGAALAQAGVTNIDGPSPEICFWGISRLASKVQIAQARDEIRMMLTRGLAQTAPQLDAGLTGARIRK